MFLQTDRAKTFYEKERRHPASVKVAAGHWDYREKSSGAVQTVAALKSFGLLKDVVGGAGGRTIQLSDLALRILLDERNASAERIAAIKEAALSPKIHAELWRKWGAELPSDGELRHQLIFQWKFNENSIGDFIKEYKDTISFAKLTSSDTISSGSEDSGVRREPGWEGFKMPEGQQQPPPKQQPPPVGRTPVGSEIPVALDCIMGVNATGRVTQSGIEKLIAYLQLIKGSFPQNGEA